MDEIIQRQLLVGERVLWSGRPQTGLLFTPADVFLIPFSLLWGGFALYWNVGVWMLDDASWFFRLWGLPFLLVGLYITVGRFFHDAMRRRNLHYAVTNERVLVVQGGRNPRITSLDIRKLPTIELNERRDGTGSIRFGEQFMMAWARYGQWLPSMSFTPTFLAIPAVRKVYDLVQQAARSPSAVDVA
jgi:hypothetical protein